MNLWCRVCRWDGETLKRTLVSRGKWEGFPFEIEFSKILFRYEKVQKYYSRKFSICNVCYCCGVRVGKGKRLLRDYPGRPGADESGEWRLATTEVLLN